MKHFRIISLILPFAAAQLSAETLFTDAFDYPDGPIVTNSAGNWSSHSGAADQVDIASGKANLTFGESEDVNRLIGSAYSTGTLFYSLTVNFSNTPSTGGGYFAHFKDTETAGDADFIARLYVRLTAENTLEFSVGNRSTAPTSFSSETFDLLEEIFLVVGIDLDTQITSLWFNPTDPSAAPSVQDNTAFTFAGLDNSLSAFALRQATGIGTFTVDNLTVGTTFVSVIPEPSSWLLMLSAGAVLLVIWKRRRANT